MRTNYVLIDYENVQPKNLTLPEGEGHPLQTIVLDRCDSHPP